MSVKLRLKRMGRKNQPFYRIIATDTRTKRDGKEIEILGHYNPQVAEKDKKVVLQRDRVQYWLSVGAQPSDTVAGFIKQAGITK